jgi:hypothetical protein
MQRFLGGCTGSNNMTTKQIISPSVAARIIERAIGCECENPACDHGPGQCTGSLKDFDAGPGFNGPTPPAELHEIKGRAFCGPCRAVALIAREELML